MPIFYILQKIKRIQKRGLSPFLEDLENKANRGTKQKKGEWRNTASRKLKTLAMRPGITTPFPSWAREFTTSNTR